jgi:DNA invertase Pin-like site-specific DNA recombinase
MAELKIGYARVSTVDQDLTARREALTLSTRSGSMLTTA